MQIDGIKLTTPEVVDQKVASFCRKLSTATAVFVDVEPENWSRQSCCESNVEKLISLQGGEKIIGYKIWYIKNKYIEAERHVIYKNDKTLRDPTFNPDGENKILFLPNSDPTKSYEDGYLKVREGFSQRARIFAKQQNESDKFRVRGSKEESWEKMLTYEAWLAGERMQNGWRAGR